MNSQTTRLSNRELRNTMARELRSEAINRSLFKDNVEIEMLKNRLLISSAFNVLFLFAVAVFALVQAVKGW